MAKARSKKIIATTFKGDNKAIRAFEHKLHQQWPALVAAYYGQSNLAVWERMDVSDINAQAERSTKWRDEIFQITAVCIDRTLRESAPAVKFDELRDAIARIERASDELTKALDAIQSGILPLLTCKVLARQFSGGGDFTLTNMRLKAHYLADAARFASQAMTAQSCVEEGQARDEWIAALRKFATDNRLPTSVSYKSPFVRLVGGLRALAPDLLGHHKDPGALSQEITRAIKKAKERADAQAEADAKAEAKRLAEEAEYIAAYEREMAAEESRRESNERSRWR